MQTTMIPAARRVPPLRRALEAARSAGVPQWAVAEEAHISPSLLSMVARGRVRATERRRDTTSGLGCETSLTTPQ